MDANLVKKLVASIKCGVCGRQFELANIDILGHHEDLWLLKSSCSHCKAQCLMAAIIKEEKVTRVITDLTEAERHKFRNIAAIGADDILDMHSFLKDFSGDFSRLFSPNHVEE